MEKVIDRWFTAEVTCEPTAVEAVESAFNAVGSSGTSTDGLRKSAEEPLAVTGYFDTPPETQDVHEAVKSSLRLYGLSYAVVSDISFGEVEQTDWLAEWKRHWKPTSVGRFIIAPPWSDIVEENRLVIRIEPNMAFGTGTHETTKLCLAVIDEHFDPDDSFLDVGTGTGVLAIAASMLGGRGIFAYDTDADSVAIARENAVANGVADRIAIFGGSITDDTPPHDFVCANLTLDVIGPILEQLISKTRKMLVLSGILVTQQDAIAAELNQRGLSNFEITHAGEWISVIVRV